VKQFFKLTFYLLTLSIVLLLTQTCEIENQSSKKQLIFNTDTVNYYVSILNELMDSSKYFMDYDASNIAHYYNDELTNNIKSEDSLICSDRSRCELGLSAESYKNVFKSILNNPDIIDVYMKVAKNGGIYITSQNRWKFCSLAS
jgi:hypothetical protein